MNQKQQTNFWKKVSKPKDPNQNGKSRHLGYFVSEEEARNAYLAVR